MVHLLAAFGALAVFARLRALRQMFGIRRLVSDVRLPEVGDLNVINQQAAEEAFDPSDFFD